MPEESGYVYGQGPVPSGSRRILLGMISVEAAGFRRTAYRPVWSRILWVVPLALADRKSVV